MYLDDATITDNLFDSLMNVFSSKHAGDRVGQRCLTDGRLIGQLAALIWTVALADYVVSHVQVKLPSRDLID